MHLERAERLTALPDEVAELRAVLGAFRWRLGVEHLVRFGLRGLAASGIALLALSLAAWASESSLESLTDGRVWLVGLPLVAAIGLAAARWPTQRQAALVADRRLALDERLGTAVELAGRLAGQTPHAGRFDRLQLRDAVDRARQGSRPPLAFTSRARAEALVVGLVALLAVGSLWLPGLPRPSLPVADQTAPIALGEDPAADAMERAAAPELPDVAAPDLPTAQSPVDADLAARVQQEQAERNALDRLAQALDRVSAGKGAAEAIQQGDFASARDQLATLGEEADQLSDAAKQQLSRALQQSSAATAATDRQLADRERQAAQALSRNNYAEQRQALRNLGEQVERSGARTTSAEQLARDMGRLQQQQAASAADGQAGAGQQSGAAGQQSQTAAPGQGAAATAGQGGDGTAEGQGGPGTGTGAGADALGTTPTRLDAAGQSVQVPTKLGAGPGVRPTDGTEEDLGTDPMSRTRPALELVQPQQTGQVTPEQNLVPGEQRPVVRGYFR